MQRDQNFTGGAFGTKDVELAKVESLLLNKQENLDVRLKGEMHSLEANGQYMAMAHTLPRSPRRPVPRGH